ncbi:hypothetical protein QJS04_geneDACA015311 [Acorus gramineus]|uniref:Uncharacterized protein n=1 Tax=Acorus gramineus TaxID=55184 RepID=A0AAV9ANY5_ACOGR|nr:hypothetical protein QJS04_geneDACA015311 [Acorus gramineus]
MLGKTRRGSLFELRSLRTLCSGHCLNKLERSTSSVRLTPSSSYRVMRISFTASFTTSMPREKIGRSGSVSNGGFNLLPCV